MLAHLQALLQQQLRAQQQLQAVAVMTQLSVVQLVTLLLRQQVQILIVLQAMLFWQAIPSQVQAEISSPLQVQL